MTRLFVLFIMLLAARSALAAPVDIASDLYTAKTIVTGTDDRERPTGFARCFRDVLVKLTGDAALADDPRVADDEANAEALAEDFVYQDRMSDIPTHDEQGTRDRPFDLTVHFVPEKINGILARLNVPVWRDPRPPLVLLVTMARGGDNFPMAADTLPDTRPREAAEAAGWKYGLRVVLLPEAAIKAVASLDAVPLPQIPNAVALHGTLTWDPKRFGWVGNWSLTWHGQPHAWSISGVSYDEAFRDAVRGASGILSGRT